MKRLLLVVFINLLFSDIVTSHWEYHDQSHWPDLCRTGKNQSPITLDRKLAKERFFDKFIFSNYDAFYEAVVKNNGHSVQLKINGVQPTLSGGGLDKQYFLDHLHFHWKSEHTIDGYRYPLEVHLVHFASDYGNLQSALQHPDGLAVLAVLYELSPDDDVKFQPLISVIKNVEAEPDLTNMMNAVHLDSFLPRDTAGYYRYNGSLTTPSCDESVIWTIFTNTIPISQQQVHHFESVHAHTGILSSNYRKLQSIGDRTIYRKISPIPHGTAVSINTFSSTLFNVLSVIVVLFS